MEWKRIALALLMLAASSAEAREVPPLSGTVTIRFRHPYMICAGVCPRFRVEIFDNGEVVRSSPESTDRPQLLLKSENRFHVVRAKLGQFRSELERLRPKGDLALDNTCDQTKRPDGSPDPASIAKPDDIEVRWIEPGRSDRLTSCAYDEPLRAELESALRTLGVDPLSGMALAPSRTSARSHPLEFATSVR